MYSYYKFNMPDIYIFEYNVTIGGPWADCGRTVGEPWGGPWENCGRTMGRIVGEPWGGRRRTMGEL